MLFGPSPYGLRLINMLLFLGGAVLLFRVARVAFGKVPAFAGLAIVLFVPTLFFWSISLLKESLYFFLTATVVASAYEVVRGGPRRRVAIVVAGALALWAMRDLRPGAVLLTGGGVTAGLLLYAATATRRRLAVAVVVALAFGGLALSQPMVKQRLQSAIDQAAIMHIGHVFTVGHPFKLLDEGFYVKWYPDPRLTPGESARYAVRALVSFAVVPLPWQMATRSELVFLPEHLLWYMLLLLAPAGVLVGARCDRLFTCLLVGIIIPASIVVAFTNGNVGTLIRFRGLVTPYLVWLGALGGCAVLQYMVTRGANARGIAPDAPMMEHA
jgi:hypothetical protein